MPAAPAMPTAPAGVADPSLVRPALVRTSSSRPSVSMVTLPLVSVRKVWAPTAASRSRACRVGCPYGLSSPALTTATRGRSAARKASVVAVRLP